MTAPDVDPSPNRLAPWRATGVLLLFLAFAVGLLLGPLRAPHRVSVDALDLLPRDEQDPTIRLARQTAGGRLGRTVLLALSDAAHPDQAPTAAAARMAELLRADASIAGTFSGLREGDKERLQAWFFERRLPLRFPAWLDGQRARWTAEGKSGEPSPEWLAERVVADINDFRLGPGADFATDLLPRDPLLLIPGLLDVFSADERSAKGVAGGALTGEERGVRHALVYAETRVSPLEEGGQKPVFAAIDRALRTVQTETPGGASLRLRWSGVSKFAADTRQRAEGEVKLLSNLSLAGSAVLMLLVFRSLLVFAYLVLPILTATAWSMVVCFSVFPRVHVVTLIFTSVLVGVALDYGIYSLIHAQRTRGGLREALRDLRRPLIAGCLTSVGGFAFLVLTNLPMLQQMGLAVALGLIFSLALDFLYLPWVPALRVEPAAAREGRAPSGPPFSPMTLAPKDADPTERVPPGAGLSQPSGPVKTPGVEMAPKRLDLSGRLFPALIVALPVVLAGWVWASRPHWNDDIRALQSVDAKMQAEEHALRGMFGQSSDEKLMLTFGNGLDDAFANVSRLNATLATARGKGGNEAYFNLGRLFPDAAASQRAADYLRAHPEFADTLRRALDADFNADVFAPFFEAWSAYLETLKSPAPPSRLLAGLRDVLPLPLQNLWNDEDPQTAWLATRVSETLYNRLPPGTIAPPNLPVDQVETLNGALKRYRVTALQRGGLGLGIIAVAVLGVYGWRRGAFMLMVPLSSMFFALGTFGFMGHPLSLLHVIAHLLGFCLASDYSIFLASPGDLPHSTRKAVRLAGLVTWLSFTVLSFSHMEALRDICLTVSLVIAFDLMLCEVSHRLFVREVGES